MEWWNGGIPAIPRAKSQLPNTLRALCLSAPLREKNQSSNHPIHQSSNPPITPPILRASASLREIKQIPKSPTAILLAKSHLPNSPCALCLSAPLREKNQSSNHPILQSSNPPILQSPHQSSAPPHLRVSQPPTQNTTKGAACAAPVCFLAFYRQLFRTRYGVTAAGAMLTSTL